MSANAIKEGLFEIRLCRTKLGGLALLLAAVAPFCEDSFAVKVPTHTAAVVEEEISLSAAPMSDILFVVDNSGSMAEEQDQLAVNFQKFIDVVDDAANWYQIGIITTDMNTGVGLSGCTCPKANPQDENCIPNYDLRFGGKLLSAQGVPKILKPPKNRPRRPDDPLPDADAPPDESTLRNWFAQNIHVGTDGCGFEKGLESARAAVTPPLDTTDNAGFLRNDAVLIVIWVTDEEDCSHDPGAFKESRGDECVRFSNLLTRTSEYIEFFRNVKGDPRKVALAAICGATIQKVASDCKQDQNGNPIPVAGNCDPTQQGACAGRRYIEVVNALGGMVDSICRADFSQTMIDLGNFVKEVNSYSLSRVPDCDDPNCEGEIMVKVSMCENDPNPETCAAGQGYPQCDRNNITQTDCYECSKEGDKMRCWRRIPQCIPPVVDNCWQYNPPVEGGRPIITFEGNTQPRLGQDVKLLFLVDPESSGGGGSEPPPPVTDGGV